MSRLRRPIALAVVCLGLAAPALLVPPAQAAEPRIGPNQSFSGLVNGKPASAEIQMACFGPERPGQMGHPFAGQYVEAIFTPGPLPGGFTGSAADRLVADFVLPSAARPEALTITHYIVHVAIPTRFELPCSGSGTVAFIPLPTSPTARSENVSVTYVPQP
jgi:hypothetical protein